MPTCLKMKVVVELGKPIPAGLLVSAEGPVVGDYIVIGCTETGSPIVRCPEGDEADIPGDDLVVAGWTPAFGRRVIPGL